jgi:hypothetical protein
MRLQQPTVKYPDPYHEAIPGGIRLVIPGYLPPGMNTTFSQHWAVRREAKQECLLYLRAAAGRDFPRFRKAVATMTCYRIQPMDADNLMSSFKFVGDGLVTMGMVPDDNPDCLDVKVMQVRVPHKSEMRTVIEIIRRQSSAGTGG